VVGCKRRCGPVGAAPGLRAGPGRRTPRAERAGRRALVSLLDDGEMTVVEAAAWALGELGRSTEPVVAALAVHATDHADPLVRVAACGSEFGALGDRRGPRAVLAACDDLPRCGDGGAGPRPFDGATVDAALAGRAATGDWQDPPAAGIWWREPPTEPGGVRLVCN